MCVLRLLLLLVVMPAGEEGGGRSVWMCMRMCMCIARGGVGGGVGRQVRIGTKGAQERLDRA